MKIFQWKLGLWQNCTNLKNYARLFVRKYSTRRGFLITVINRFMERRDVSGIQMSTFYIFVIICMSSSAVLLSLPIFAVFPGANNCEKDELYWMWRTLRKFSCKSHSPCIYNWKQIMIEHDVNARGVSRLHGGKKPFCGWFTSSKDALISVGFAFWGV